jgi:hypothetical protein
MAAAASRLQPIARARRRVWQPRDRSVRGGRPHRPVDDDRRPHLIGERAMQQPPTDVPSTPGREPAEGRPDLNLPGADRPDVDDSGRQNDPDPNRTPPDGPAREQPERLGAAIELGPGEGIARGEPDLVADVEPPDESM